MLFKQNKICCIADIHIGIHQNSPFWHKVHLDWGNWLVAELKQKEIKDIVICGDYFHPRDEIAVNSLNEGTKLLELFNDFNVHIVCGNHDVFLKNSSEIHSLRSFKNWKNVNVYDTVQKIDDFVFVPWGANIAHIPQGKIIFGHFEINTFKMNTFKMCESGVAPEQLCKLAPLIISGHFHLRDIRKHKKGTIMYTGNPFEMDYADAGASKGYYIVDTNTLEYEFTENTLSPKHSIVNLSWLCEQGTVNELVKSKVTNNIVKYIIDRKVNTEDNEFIVQHLKNLKPIQFETETQYERSEFNDNEVRHDFSGISVEEAITEYVSIMEANNKDDILKYVMNLYNKIK